MSETCRLAAQRIRWLHDDGRRKEMDEAQSRNPYCSVDPAPPMEETNVEKLTTVLLDEDLPLFERYRYDRVLSFFPFGLSFIYPPELCLVSVKACAGLPDGGQLHGIYLQKKNSLFV